MGVKKMNINEKLEYIEKNVLKSEVRNKLHSQALDERRKTFYELNNNEKAYCLIEAYCYLISNHNYKKRFFTDDDINFFTNYDFKNFIKEFEKLPVSEAAKIQILDEALQYGVEFGY